MGHVTNENRMREIHQALTAFASPECLDRAACLAVDFKDFLQMGYPVSPEKRSHLIDGFNHLIDAYRFAATAFHPDSTADRTMLFDVYLSGVKPELQEGGAWGAVYGDLRNLKMSTDAGHITTEGDMCANIEGIVLGYTLYVENQFGVDLDWNEVKNKLQKTIEPPQSNPPPTQNVEIPPMIPQPIGKTHIVGPGNNMGDQIQALLDLPSPVSHYQIAIVSDLSWSMDVNVEAVRRKAEAIVAKAKEQVKPGGTVSIGVWGYVEKKKIFLPMSDVQDGASLEKALLSAKKTTGYFGDGDERTWDVTHEILKSPFFQPSPDTANVIFVMSDFEAMIGKETAGNLTSRKIQKEAVAKGVRLEVLRHMPFSVEKAKQILLEGNDADKGEFAELMLAGMRTQKAREALSLVLLNKPSDRMSHWIVDSIDQLDDRRFAPVLRQFFVENNYGLWATDLLERWGMLDQELVEKAFLSHSSLGAHIALLDWIKKQKPDPSWCPTFEKILSDEDGSVLEIDIGLLGEFACTQSIPLLEKDLIEVNSFYGESLSKTLDKLGAPHPMSRKALFGDNENACKLAAQQLAVYENPDISAPYLSRFLDSNDLRTQLRSVDALAILHTPMAMASLNNALAKAPDGSFKTYLSITIKQWDKRLKD